jgi:hypothetical protein
MKVYNTTQAVRDIPELGVITLMEKEGIERQEAQGQRSLAASTQIPRRCGLTDEQLLQLGFTQLGEKTGDLFRDVVLPPGWKKVPTDHSLWTDLVDDKGRKRASIFYKAAFYDREAFMSFIHRYTIQKDYNHPDKDTRLIFQVFDAAVPLFSCSAVVPHPNQDRGAWLELIEPTEEVLRQSCLDFLIESGIDPKNEDPLRYWEDS